MCIYQTFPTDLTMIGRKRFLAETYPVAPIQKKRRVIKSVRFNDAANQVVASPAFSSPDTWCTPNDYTSFKQNMKRDVLYLASLCAGTCQQTPEAAKEYSPMGLEKYCCSAADQKQSKAVKQQRIYAVLDQQLLQRHMGYKNEESMKLMAHVLSLAAVQKGIDRAQRLAKTC